MSAALQATPNFIPEMMLPYLRAVGPGIYSQRTQLCRRGWKAM